MASAGAEVILLQPRLYAQRPGKLLLLPLMPFKRPSKPLPSEIWGDILAFAVVGGGREATKWAFSYLTICKSLKVSLSLFTVSDCSIHHFVLQGCCSPCPLFGCHFHLYWTTRKILPVPLHGRPKMGFYPSNSVFSPWTMGSRIRPLGPHIRRCQTGSST